MHCFEETRDIDCSAHDFFSIVMDIESYPDFLPWVAEASILDSSEDQLSAELVIEFSGVKYSFRTVDRFVVNRMVEIRLLDGPFNFLESLWTFEEIDNEHCRVHYSIEFEFKNMLLSLLATPVFSMACKTMVKTFEDRVKQNKR